MLPAEVVLNRGELFTGAASKAFNEEKQRYGAPRLADELPEYSVKPLPPACAVRDFGRRPRVSSGRSATVNMVCQYQRIC